MKRVYEKPGIYVENFSLAQSIARKCDAAENSTLANLPTVNPVPVDGIWEI